MKDTEGTAVGVNDGTLEGVIVGLRVGVLVGVVGLTVGDRVGVREGATVVSLLRLPYEPFNIICMADEDEEAVQASWVVS